MEPTRYEWRWHSAATPEQLWPLLADTNRTNRDVGLPVVQLTLEGAGPRPETVVAAASRPVGDKLSPSPVSPGGAQGRPHSNSSAQRAPLPAGTQRLGFKSLIGPVVWDEEPYEWVYPRRFSVLRTYLSGPWEQIIVRGELLSRDAGGTEFVYSLDVRPRGKLGALISAVQLGRISARAFDRTFRRFITLAERGEPERDSHSPSTHSYDVARLSGYEQQLVAQHDPQLVAALCKYISASDESLLTHMRPYEFARYASAPRRAALDLFLQATHLGLLSLQWDLLCPRCRGAKQTQLALADVTARVHCDACRIDFSAELPQQIELTFRVSPAVRPVELHEYCIGSPRRSPHIVAQQILAAGESRDVQLTLAPGTYRLRSFANEAEGGIPDEVSIEIAGGNASTATFTAANRGWDADTAALSPDATITLRNDTSDPQVLLLERTQWRDDALTAAEAIATQRFRDLFAGELLRPGESISVGTLTVAFTDLVGSTAFYRELGDAPAFARVLDHFDVVRAAIDAEDGAVVKTMGDAVLAVFHSPAQALRAMKRAQLDLGARTFRSASDIENRSGSEDPRSVNSAPLLLRASLHSGPCLAVTLNDRLDYFGTTMNLAARLTALSSGHDIVVTQSVLDDPHAAVLAGMPEPVTAELKGLTDVPPLWRIGS